MFVYFSRYMCTGFIGSFWGVSFYAYLYYVGLNVTGLIASLTLGFPAILISTHITSRIVMPIVDKIILNGDMETDEPSPRRLRKLERVKFPSRCAVLIALIYMLGLFSNSYIVYEDSVVAFLFHALTAIIALQIARDYYIERHEEELTMQHFKQKLKPHIHKNFDIMRIFTSPLSILFILVLSLNGFLRLGFYFKACREEQFACDVSNFLQPLASLAGEAAANRNLRYFLSVSSLILVPLIMRQFLKHHGNLNGTSPAVMCAHYVPILSAICVALHWALQAAPPAVLNTLATWQVG